jgi:hypothetical protein
MRICESLQVNEDDRIMFRVKDIGVLSEAMLGGMLGPRYVAQTSVKVRANQTVQLRTSKCRFACRFPFWPRAKSSAELEQRLKP